MEKRTQQYEQYLLGCRFCPMCKPASDSLNATFKECHATRAHAMIIWRAQHEIHDYSDKECELLYMCNLDGVSEAFCVDHYPVTAYMLAARRDIVDAGKAPAPVKAVFARRQDIRIYSGSGGDAVLVCAEGADLDPALNERMGHNLADKLGCGMAAGFSGYLPHVLGNDAKAREEAQSFAASLRKTGAATLVAAGPETYYTLTRLYPEWGVELGASILPLAAYLDGKLTKTLRGQKVFFHDARAACHLSETQPDEVVIMPDFFGPEDLLGKGDVYELPRALLRKQGAELAFTPWNRAMANAMGNDEGVAATYPALARAMAARRLRHIKATGAELVVTDSMATALFAQTLDKETRQGLPVQYLADLL